MIVALAAGQLAMVTLCNRIDERRRGDRLPVRAERRSDPAPDVHVERRDGERQLLAARSGRYQLFHFWATWCPPCRVELPALLERADRERSRLRVWAISTDRDWRSVERFLSGRIRDEIVRDPSGRAAGEYGVSLLPDSYLIDPEGRIRARFVGAQNWRAASMDTTLDALMN